MTHDTATDLPDGVRAPAAELSIITDANQLPDWLSMDDLTEFMHRSLKPFEDPQPLVRAGLDKAFASGGFVVIATADRRLVGGLAMLRTGMSGYIPENLLLFVAVDPSTRGQGLGRRIIQAALERCDGDVKLHVEYDNPAKRLYERIGFTSKYAEMRYSG